MDSSEKVFRLFLKQDLQRLHYIVTNLSVSEKRKEITSWYFPTKTYTFVDEFITANDIFENASDRLFLELIIDRIHVGINLLLGQIDGDCLGKFVISPKQVTLGYLFESLYQAILKMKDMKSHQIVTKDKNDKFAMINKASQTDIISLNRCDSCAAAIGCMKNIMTLFENKNFEQFNHGKRFKPRIMDVTQFGCMLQVTCSVMDNFRQLTGNAYRHAEEIKVFKIENEKLLSESANMKRKISHLEEAIQVYKQEFQKSSSKISLLSYENNELNRAQVQNELRINSLRNTVDNLNEGLAKRNSLLENVTREKNNLTKDLDVYRNNRKLLLNTIISNKKHVEKMCQDFSVLAGSFLEINENVDTLINKLQNVCKLNESAKVRVANLIEEVMHHSRDISDNIEDFKKNFKSKLTEIIKESADRLDNKGVQGFQIKGNPVEDITHQIKENEMKIRSLQLENKKLSNILTKFQLLRTVP